MRGGYTAAARTGSGARHRSPPCAAGSCRRCQAPRPSAPEATARNTSVPAHSTALTRRWPLAVPGTADLPARRGLRPVPGTATSRAGGSGPKRQHFRAFDGAGTAPAAGGAWHRRPACAARGHVGCLAPRPAARRPRPETPAFPRSRRRWRGVGRRRCLAPQTRWRGTGRRRVPGTAARRRRAVDISGRTAASRWTRRRRPAQ